MSDRPIVLGLIDSKPFKNGDACRLLGSVLQLDLLKTSHLKLLELFGDVSRSSHTSHHNFSAVAEPNTENDDHLHDLEVFRLQKVIVCIKRGIDRRTIVEQLRNFFLLFFR